MESALIFIVVLLILILVHEFGHFLFAKLFDVKVYEFGIGYKPRAFRMFKIGETEYTVNWLPFGGFVHLEGEDGEENGQTSNRSLKAKSAWKQIVILSAGAVFNFLLAWVLFSAVYFSGAPVFWDKNYIKNSDLVVVGVKEGSPASAVGLSEGDVIKKVSDKSGEELELLSPQTLSLFISKNAGKEIFIEFFDKESGQLKKETVVPAQGLIESEPSRAAIGIEMSLKSKKSYGLFESVILGFKSSVHVVKDVFFGLGSLVSGAINLNFDLNQVSGPVGIASYVGKAANMGFAYLIYFTALISANLAVINLLPFPALDGGRIVFVFAESFFRRKIPAAVENALNAIGFILLIALMIAITYNDILRLVK